MNFLDYIEGPLEDMAVKMSDLQDNMRTLQALNEQFVQFNVSFGTFLQGIKANTRIVDFPEAPLPESYDLAHPAPVEAPPSPIASPTPLPEEPEPALLESRLRPPSVTQTGRPPASKSRASSQRTKPDRKPASISIKKIMDSLPSRFHDQPHKGHIDMIVKGLFKNKDGLYLHDVIREAAISRTKAIDYLNVLVQSGHLIKLSQKVSADL
ncbi:hypothetical protein BJ085DRAFT_40699 [Dimargaris cristalligena]|uniref:DASH complex subunit DAM1 n=1 Tax=Dimargaris cristalligena TaxID=215637 RepID=A0A4P9ZKW5_9FUNG|nr:hypothetical protein BJ085DRAFT_40699 [Dimargaris cristalligena]|eukprot:RKP33212.1 hypothetical protein BJ085DRAFT_40699 [Dimargaris cristalligena]